ncbi:hypothetical protein KSP40_PGU020698 [Platanthera guangdongensis]|uniref:RNase H type-1 domain-containing protein n=1 Tax=Platanthera guangdongensis TaxID=2320717 RepID=A0ABR2M2K8_9ASPA
MYQCWHARNAKLHNREVGTPVVIAATVMENPALFDQGRTPGCWSTSRPSGHFRSFSWCPPGWIKVNLDGSLLPSRCEGLGIVVRSEGGQVLMAEGFAWQHWDPGRVELEAILAIRWVVLPTLLEARGIIIEGDATNVLDFCSKAAWGSARPNTFPGDGDLSFLTEFAAVWFQHVDRRANRVADHCARTTVAGDFVWETGTGAYETFLGLVADDCRGLEGT